jgi:hypothetical protein
MTSDFILIMLKIMQNLKQKEEYVEVYVEDFHRITMRTSFVKKSKENTC